MMLTLKQGMNSNKHLFMFLYGKISRKLLSCCIQHNADIEARNEDNWAILYIAATNNSIEVTQLLFQHCKDTESNVQYN